MERLDGGCWEEPETKPETKPSSLMCLKLKLLLWCPRGIVSELLSRCSESPRHLFEVSFLPFPRHGVSARPEHLMVAAPPPSPPLSLLRCLSLLMLSHLHLEYVNLFCKIPEDSDHCHCLPEALSDTLCPLFFSSLSAG